MGQSINCIEDIKDTNKVLYQTIKNTISNNKISHAYLVESQDLDIGLQFAKALAKAIYCENRYLKPNNCTSCNICHQIDNNEFVDLEIIKPEGMTIKKETIDNLEKKYSTKSLYYNKRVYIIHNAELMNKSSSNALLKFLEEPYDGITAILVVANNYNLLPTIKSRCIILKLNSILNINYTEEDYNKILEFGNFLEKNGIKTICHTQKLWHNYFKTKEENDKGLSLLMFLYKDILNYKLKRKVEYFKEVEKFNISIDNIIKKINIINDTKNKNLANANPKLNLDNMILEMEDDL